MRRSNRPLFSAEAVFRFIKLDLIMHRLLRPTIALVIVLFCITPVVSALAQPRGGGGGLSGREQRAIAEPFVGVTTDGTVESGLFSIRSTGVSTKPVVDAAQALLDVLTPDQRARTLFPVDDSEWRRWANQHSLKRQGVSFEEMSDEQREAAFNLMKAGLSDRGFQQSRDIMRLNHTLGEISNNLDELGEWFYYLTIMGEPSETEPWGWQLDGHHLIVNFFVLGDQVVMTPTFMGSEPIRAESGKYEGVEVMQEEEQRGLALAQSLTAEQRTKAVIGPEKVNNNAEAQAFRDNLTLDYAGISAKDLTDEQREMLLDVVESFVGHIREGHARVRMEEVQAHLDETYFAWIGEFDSEAVFYYRIHSPVVLIEFDHQRPVFMRSLPRTPQRQHIHAVIRTPNVNDYGKDLLRQHYEHSHHHNH